MATSGKDVPLRCVRTDLLEQDPEWVVVVVALEPASAVAVEASAVVAALGGRGGFGGGFGGRGGGYGGAPGGGAGFDATNATASAAPNPFTDFATGGGDRGPVIYVRNVCYQPT